MPCSCPSRTPHPPSPLSSRSQSAPCPLLVRLSFTSRFRTFPSAHPPARLSFRSDFGALDVLVANPLRLSRLVSDGVVDLGRVGWLILDEADQLFQMGFVAQIDAVIAACTSPAVRRALFTATLPEAVEELARTVVQSPVRITVGQRNGAAESVRSCCGRGRQNLRIRRVGQMSWVLTTFRPSLCRCRRR